MGKKYFPVLEKPRVEWYGVAYGGEDLLSLGIAGTFILQPRRTNFALLVMGLIVNGKHYDWLQTTYC